MEISDLVIIITPLLMIAYCLASISDELKKMNKNN